MSDKLICDQCKKEVPKEAMFDWSICQACYDEAMKDGECIKVFEHMKNCSNCQIKWEKFQTGEYDDTPCGKPSNHNNGDNSGCAECIAIKNNI